MLGLGREMSGVVVTNRDTATGHVTGPYVYKSLFLSLNINCDTPLKVTPEHLATGD